MSLSQKKAQKEKKDTDHKTETATEEDLDREMIEEIESQEKKNKNPKISALMTKILNNKKNEKF